MSTIIPRREVAPITTASDGSAVYVFASLAGYIEAIRVVGFDGSVDVSITTPYETIFSDTSIGANATFRPRAPVCDLSGDAIENEGAPVLLIGDKVTITVANGGDAQTGVVIIEMLGTPAR